jgi:putative methionine-R-sulfoxide reductase with GAF domain
MMRRRAAPQGSPRFAVRESLGRKLALVLLPLVLVPLLVMGTVAYLRTRAILREQVRTEMTAATRSQLGRIDNWTVARQQQLTLASQRTELLDPLADALRMASSGGIDAVTQEDLRARLADLRSQSGETLFSELLVARAQDGLILSATLPEWEGRILPSLASGAISGNQAQTVPLHDDPMLSPSSLAIATILPMTSPDVVLVGVNSGFRLGQMINELRAFVEEGSVYRLGHGQTFLVTNPNLLVSLGPGAVEPTVETGIAHPVLSTGESDDPQSLEYNNPDGVAVVGAYEWIPGWNMAIVNEVERDLIYGELATLAPFTAVVMGAAALFTVIVVVVATDRLLRPLGPLTEFAGRISRGDWDYRVPEGSQDELGVVARAFNRMADDLSGMYRSLEARVEERTRQVRTASEVARAVISTPNLEDLMRRAVDVIRERFGYYHAAIFLLDDTGEKAILRSATGEVGAALIARGHALGVGSTSIIGWVTSHNEPRVASDVSRDPVHFRSELLPGTRSEAAVPLQVGGRVLGALDVQSLEANAFTAEDLAMLQTLADQLSAAIQNARLAQTSALAADRARLISQATTQMAGVLDMSRVLETAAGVLHRALGQPEIVVRLARPGDGGAGQAPPTPEEVEAEP